LISFDIDVSPSVDLPFTDKIVHFVFHCIAMLLGGAAVRIQFNAAVPFGRPFVFMAVGLFLYGIAIEGLQAVLPTGRSAELLDVLSNTLGLTVGALILKLLFKIEAI
jgi:VanZ family protein